MDELMDEVRALRDDVRNLTVMLTYLVEALDAEQIKETSPLMDMDGNVLGVAGGNCETLDDA